MIFIQIISTLLIVNVCKGEISLSTCSSERPFPLNNFTCGSFEDVCLKKEDNNCNILRKACQQCPPTNYTILMLNDIIMTTKNSTKILKNYINEKTYVLKNEINNYEKKIGDIEDQLIKIKNNSNYLKNEINNNEKKIGDTEDRLINIKKKIENNTNYLKTELDTIRNFLANETNLIKDSLNLLQIFLDNETNIMKNIFQNWLDKRKKNETIESQGSINRLSNRISLIGNYIIVITIFLITIIILLILLILKIFDFSLFKKKSQPITETRSEKISPEIRNMDRDRLLSEEKINKANVPLKSTHSHYDSKKRYFAATQQI